MSRLAIAAILILVVVAQVTVAPLFPLRAAVPDFALLTLIGLAMYRRPATTMLALPILALLLAFSTDRAPGLLLLVYLPLLPLAALIEGADLPLNRYARITIALVVSGLWARTLLALAAIAQGAEPETGALVRQVLLPGMVLDWGLLTVVYVPSRLLGWRPQRMILQRGGF